MTISISNVFPENGAIDVSKNTLVSFDITSDVPLEFLNQIQIYINNTSYTAAYYSESFYSPFDGPESSVVSITNGYHFVIDNTSEYPPGVTSIYVFNDSTYDSFEFTVSPTVEVLNKVPLPDLTGVSEETLITFDVIANVPILSSDIIISIDDVVIYDGVDFISPFDGSKSEAIEISNGYSFIIENTSYFNTDSLVFLKVELNTFEDSWSFHTETISVLNKNPLPDEICFDKDTMVGFDSISNGIIGLENINVSIDGSNVFTATPFIYFGTPVVFTKTNYVPTEDIISSAVHITRDNTKGIYNNVVEISFDDDNYISPIDTEWTYYNVPWGDLSDVKSREYFTWSEALEYSPRYYLVDAELVMHIISEDRFFKVKFTSWTNSGLGGGFSYERTEILFSTSIDFLPPFNGPSSSIVEITNGYRFLIDKISSYDYKEIPVVVGAYSFEDSWVFSVTAIPEVLNKFPLQDAIDIAETTLVSFDVVSDWGLRVEDIVVTINSNVIFDGTNFIPPFDGPSSGITNITDGYSFVVDNTGFFDTGSLVSLRVDINTINYSWSFRIREIEVLNRFPVSGTIDVDVNTLINFDIISNIGIVLEDVLVYVEGILGYDGTNFLPPFDGVSSSVVSILDGYTFTIEKTSGYSCKEISVLISSYSFEDTWSFFIIRKDEVLNKFPLADAININETTVVGFDVVSNAIFSPEDIIVAINSDVIFDGTNFIPPFDGPSSGITNITDGYSFVIDNTGFFDTGSLVSLIVDVNTFEDSWSFRIRDIYTSNKLPTPHSIGVGENTLISFDVTSDSVINLDQVNVYVEGLLCFDGTNFITPFDGVSSGVVSILDGYTFAINKTLPYSNKEIPVITSIYSFEDIWSFYVGLPPINATNKLPLANARGVSENSLVCFNVVSYASLALSAIKIYIDNKIIYDGDFIAPFNGPSSNVSAITDGYRFVIDNTLPYDNFVSLRVNYDI